MILSITVQIMLFLYLISTSVYASEIENRINSDDFWDRIKAIKEVPDLSQQQIFLYIPILIKLLNDEDQSVRIEASASLAKIGKPAVEAIPIIISNFGRPNGEEALSYVSDIVKFDKLAVPRLIKALKNSNYHVKSHSITALKMIGAPAKEAIPELKRISMDVNRDSAGKIKLDRKSTLSNEAVRAINAIETNR